MLRRKEEQTAEILWLKKAANVKACPPMLQTANDVAPLGLMLV
jgi:hypothetical protein